jgi:hypothetical protein
MLKIERRLENEYKCQEYEKNVDMQKNGLNEKSSAENEFILYE